MADIDNNCTVHSGSQMSLLKPEGDWRVAQGRQSLGTSVIQLGILLNVWQKAVLLPF